MKNKRIYHRIICSYVLLYYQWLRYRPQNKKQKGDKKMNRKLWERLESFYEDIDAFDNEKTEDLDSKKIIDMIESESVYKNIDSFLEAVYEVSRIAKELNW